MNKRATRQGPPELPTQCESCGLEGFKAFSTLVVSKTRATEAGTYLLDGQLKLEYCVHGQCKNCGSVYTILKRSLPVQCTGLPCPRCEKADKLVYKIQTVERGPKSFNFEVEVECRRCNWRRTASKLLRALWNSLRIKVSPTTLEVEKVAGGVK